MKVKAKHWVWYNGWHEYGDIFEIAGTDADAMADMVEIVETPISQPADGEQPEQPKRGRTKKTEA